MKNGIRNRIKSSWESLKQRAVRIEKESVLRAAGLLTGVFAFVWWCVLYPELCFPQDTYEAVYETEEDEEGRLIFSTEENCHSLLQAEEEQVIVKSRLLEWLRQHGYIDYAE